MADATGFMLGEMEKELPPEIIELAKTMTPEQKMEFYSNFMSVIQTGKEAEGKLDMLNSIVGGVNGITKSAQEFNQNINRIKNTPSYNLIDHLSKPIGGKMQDLGSAFKGMFTGE